MIVDVRCLVRQLALEAFLEKRDQVDRHDEEDEKDAGELDSDHEQRHQGVRPVEVGAVAGRRERFGGPHEARPEIARLALEARHPRLVEDGEQDEEAGDRRDEEREPALGAGHCEILRQDHPAPRQVSSSRRPTRSSGRSSKWVGDSPSPALCAGANGVIQPPSTMKGRPGSLHRPKKGTCMQPKSTIGKKIAAIAKAAGDKKQKAGAAAGKQLEVAKKAAGKKLDTARRSRARSLVKPRPPPARRPRR